MIAHYLEKNLFKKEVCIFDTRIEQLSRKQDAFQTKRMGRTLQEQCAFELVVAEHTFRIDVAEKRLNDHENIAISLPLRSSITL